MLKRTLFPIALIAALALPAAATADTIASGTTTIQVAAGFKNQLSPNGVKMSPRKLAIKGGAASTIDPTIGSGDVQYKGKLTFRKGGKKLILKSLEAKLGAGGKLTGQAKGKNVKIAKLAGGTVTRSGFAAQITGIKATFTKSAARRVNKALELSSLKAGKLGTVSLDEQPSDVAIQPEGRLTLVASDKAVGEFLLASGGIVSASAIPPAEQQGLTTFFLPIAGGTAAPNLTSGETQLAGGIKQEQMSSGKVIDLSNFLLQWEGDGFLRADSTQFGTNGVAFLDRTTATISSDPVARTITFENVTARFNEAAANLTNLTFGTNFQPNDPLGTLSATLTAR